MWLNFVYDCGLNKWCDWNIGPVLRKNMQIPSRPPIPFKKIRFHFLVQNDARCSEANEKSILRLLWFFLVFDFIHNFQVFLPNKNGKKMSFKKMRNVLKQIFVLISFFLEILSFWDMINFVFYPCNAFRTEQKLKK